MDLRFSGRRAFLKHLSAVGVSGVPALLPGWPSPFSRGLDAMRRHSAPPAYDPAAKFELNISEVNSDARRLDGR